ncbi:MULTISPECIES: hypothetical protein [Asticcacaulis]|uniref:hypothetical protein n=1 Tax=Asticcacaulis TaxID=76890 RepID=UPI001AE1A136|nr:MULTISPECIES: hypothetical protein [Asticcacaulis]MBP2158437.1 hypothetical protein [Asticcacaulis solisilvae]MDR6799482.1 hypothetical protein [Asticcacaulis sp. BE141]
MKSPYGNPWTRNPYANPKREAAKAEAKKRAQALMMNVAIWSSVPATIVTIVAVLASHG